MRLKKTALRALAALLALVLPAMLPASPVRAEPGPAAAAAAYFDTDTLYAFAWFPGYAEEELPLTGLMVNGVQVGEAQQPQPLRAEGAPGAEWLLLVDNSTSMPAYRYQLQTLAETILASDPEARMSLATFGVDFQVQAEGMTGAAEVRNALTRLSYAERGTDICGGAIRGIDYMATERWTPGALCRVVLVTDGIPFYSRDSAVEAESEQIAADALREAQAGSAQILFHTVCMGSGEWEPVTHAALTAGLGLDLRVRDTAEAAEAGAAMTEFESGLCVMAYPLEYYSSTLGLRVGSTELLTLRRSADITAPPEPDEDRYAGLPVVIDIEDPDEAEDPESSAPPDEDASEGGETEKAPEPEPPEESAGTGGETEAPAEDAGDDGEPEDGADEGEAADGADEAEGTEEAGAETPEEAEADADMDTEAEAADDAEAADGDSGGFAWSTALWIGLGAVAVLAVAAVAAALLMQRRSGADRNGVDPVSTPPVAPQGFAPQEYVPQPAAPQVYPADYGATQGAAPMGMGQELPILDVPAWNVPAQSVPVQNTPVQNIPAQDMPAQDTPIQSVPAQDIPDTKAAFAAPYGMAGPGAGGAGLPMQMEVIFGNVRGGARRFVLNGQLTLGSDERCDVVAEDPTVAPLHARIYISGGRVMIEDMGTPGGTALGGMRIYAPNPLRSGDEIILGNVCLTFYYSV